MIEVIAAATGGTWTAVLIAALGSSAIGAIVGGYMTTRMRGRFEREEAWRTRLITAADDLNNTLVQALWALGSLLPSVARGERRLRNDDGTLTEEATTSIKSLRDLQDQAEVALVRVELLYSSSSAVYQHALQVRRLIGSSIRAAECRPRAVNLIKAVLAERETGGTGFDLLAESAEDGLLLAVLLWRPTPETFDPSDDENVARWARALHGAAVDSVHEYMAAAQAHIQAYRAD